MNWLYVPKFITNGNAIMKSLYNELLPYLRKRSGSRYSCVLSDGTLKSYGGIENILWKHSPTLIKIKQKLEIYTQEKFDYCLVHLYMDGQANIAWHNDREALNSKIGSLSLGTTRKFRFRKIGMKSGWDYEYELNSGDLVLMLNSCQSQWEHCVPRQTTIKTPRMNCTFRQFE